MKVVALVLGVFIGLSLVPSLVFSAQDFSKMSNDELYAQKQQLSNMSSSDRNAWSAEWQKRVVNMTPEERKKYNVMLSDREIEQLYKDREAGR